MWLLWSLSTRAFCSFLFCLSRVEDKPEDAMATADEVLSVLHQTVAEAQVELDWIDSLAVLPKTAAEAELELEEMEAETEVQPPKKKVKAEPVEPDGLFEHHDAPDAGQTREDALNDAKKQVED